MAAIIWTDVTNVAPELASISVGAQTLFLAVANTALKVSVWGGEESPRLKLGRVLFAAHLASPTASGTGGSGGPVRREEVDDIVREFQTQGSAAGTLGATTYGAMLRTLMRMNGAVCMVA